MILIVGGAGYIGSHTNKLLTGSGYDTVVFDNLSTGHLELAKWGTVVLGDLADKDKLRRCFRQYPIEAVMHFAALAYVGESVMKPDIYYRNNVANVLNLLDVMREHEVRYFIFSSSCATYGVPQEIPITESHLQRPINPYGRTKLMVEQILKDYNYAYGLQYICLRYFNAAGADPDGETGEWHDPETHLTPLAIHAALGKTDGISIYGTDYQTHDGTCVRDYIHVSDLAHAHLRALEYLKRSERSGAFNLGNDRGYSVREIIDQVKKVSRRTFTVREEARRPGDPPVLVSSSRNAMDVLDWKPQFADIELIVRTAWDWHVRQAF